MLVQGIGIRDIRTLLKISITKVLNVLTSTHYTIIPQFSLYDCLEIDEFWTYVRESGEIVGYVWGKRDRETAEKLRNQLKRLGIEGNNCRMRYRIRRAFRRTCCFSKKVLNHLKAFEMVFFYINYGFV
jgi:hypothetical protein